MDFSWRNGQWTYTSHRSCVDRQRGKNIPIILNILNRQLLSSSYIYNIFISIVQGNGISAEIPGNLAEEKGSIIEENEIYEISRFTISSARQMFKPVHIDKMIHFTYHTIIKASLDSPSTFPRYVYHLTPLHQIESYIQKNEYFLGKFITSKLFTNYYCWMLY